MFENPKGATAPLLPAADDDGSSLYASLLVFCENELF